MERCERVGAVQVCGVGKGQLQQPLAVLCGQGGEVITYRGRPYAKWTDSAGKIQRAPLNAAGNKIVRESDCYTVQYFDHNGKRRKVYTSYPDKDAAQQYANQLEKEAEDRRRGMIDATQERFTTEARRALAEHLADFKAAMQSANRTDKHVRRTVQIVEDIATAADFKDLQSIEADGVNTSESGPNGDAAFFHHVDDGYLRPFVPRAGRRSSSRPAKYPRGRRERPRGPAGNGDGRQDREPGGAPGGAVQRQNVSNRGET